MSVPQGKPTFTDYKRAKLLSVNRAFLGMLLFTMVFVIGGVGVYIDTFVLFSATGWNIEKILATFFSGVTFLGFSFVITSLLIYCLRAGRRTRNIRMCPEGLLVVKGSDIQLLRWTNVHRVFDPKSPVLPKDGVIVFSTGESIRIPTCLKNYGEIIAAARSGLTPDGQPDEERER